MHHTHNKNYIIIILTLEVTQLALKREVGSSVCFLSLKLTLFRGYSAVSLLTSLLSWSFGPFWIVICIPRDDKWSPLMIPFELNIKIQILKRNKKRF